MYSISARYTVYKTGMKEETQMAFDGIFTRAMANDLNKKLSMGKIEKVYQPEPEELVLHIHTNNGNRKLMITCSSNGARMHLIENTPENPPAPYKFCMLLRKHLQGGRIVEISQHGCERIIEIELETMDEMGFTVNRKLIAEIMGKHSNIILTDTASGKILDSIKHVSLDVNRVRQILPGKKYEYPPEQDKIPYDSPDGFPDYDRSLPEDSVSKKILSEIGGISPAVAGTLACGGNISKKLSSICDYLDSGDYSASVYLKDDKTPLDFNVIPLSIYEDVCEKLCFEDISRACEYYFVNRESSNRIKQKANDLKRAVNTKLSKLLLKKKRLNEDLMKAENSEKYRLYGELITANIHLMKTGDKNAEVINYYDGKPVTIPLDERFSPSKNAQRYFKKYSKSKTALREKQIQLSENETEIAYLNSVLTFIDNAASVKEIDDIRSELIETGVLRKRKSSMPARKSKIKFMEFRTSDGFRVCIGRNNKENDQLTLKTAASKDWWFHTKDIPGSHVILFSEGKPLTETAIFEAASAAAFYSKGRTSENVPVDYTKVKYVKKPSGAKPGMVIFTDNRTVYVTPENPIKE